jgi:beta-mannosidase
MMDWFGQAAAPYYFLKRTYEPVHVTLDLQRLIWAESEEIQLIGKVINATGNNLSGHISVTVYDSKFNSLWTKKANVEIGKGPSVTQADLGNFKIPSGYTNRYLFVVAEFVNHGGEMISRSVYYPRVLEQMNEAEFYEKYVNEPVPWITLDKGPWLKPTVAETQTKLTSELISLKSLSPDRSQMRVKVTNTGKVPAFMTKLDITGIKRAFYASDNYFWLAEGESREIEAEILWREPEASKKIALTASAWNAKTQVEKLDLSSQKR